MAFGGHGRFASAPTKRPFLVKIVYDNPTHSTQEIYDANPSPPLP